MTVVRQSATFLYLNVNGQVISMKIKISCSNGLQPIEEPVEIKTKLVQTSNGGAGVKAVYRVEGPYGNIYKVQFRFSLPKKRIVPTATFFFSCCSNFFTFTSIYMYFPFRELRENSNMQIVRHLRSR